jgi:hypothetical protein
MLPPTRQALLVLLLLAGSVAAATTSTTPPAVPTHPLAQVGDQPAIEKAFSLRGDRLAWAAHQERSVDILLTNLTTGATTRLSSVPVARAVDLQSLSFDGRWVVWSDRRLGHFNLYAVDAGTGQATRLTDGLAEDLQVSVDAGVVAWVRGNTVQTLDIATRKAAAFPVAGRVGELAFRDRTLAWSQIEGAARALVVQPLNGTQAILRDPASQAFDPWVGEGRVVWEQRFMSAPQPPALPARIDSVLRSLDLATGQVANLTGRALVDQPSTGPGRTAWVDEGQETPRLAIREGGRSWSLEGVQTRAQLSSTHLVTQGGATGEAPLYAVAWSDVGGIPWALIGWIAAAVILVAGLPLLLMRLRSA